MAGMYATALLFLVIYACNEHAMSLSRSDFYSLVGGEIERNLPVVDDGRESITSLDPRFFFFGSNYSDLFVSCRMNEYQKTIYHELMKMAGKWLYVFRSPVT